jgi:hypothetical protein
MYAKPIIYDQSGAHTVWRFYTEPDHEWKWQRLSVQGEVIAQSAMSYKSYDGCVADAKDSGYVFHPSQTRKSFDSSMHLRGKITSM